ncbi:MAG: hypothetical protein LBT81_01260 [Helicobacteraceae bacterium]|jgi:hypothetical protein|nr:hypothetical protein [Helicobacteraceae bacterium]
MSLILFALAAFFGGCDSEDSDEAKRYERQMALDEGDWQKALSLTENCGGDQACRNDRAAAYVVKAGLSASKIITAIEEESSGSYFAQLGDLFRTSASESLQAAMDEYMLTIGNQAVCQSGSSANKWQKDACFNRSLAAISQSAAIIVNFLNASNCWVSFCGTIDDNDVDALVNLIFFETDTLVNLFGIDSDTREEIEKIKSDINNSSSLCNDTNSCKTAILKYINNNK